MSSGMLGVVAMADKPFREMAEVYSNKLQEHWSDDDEQFSDGATSVLREWITLVRSQGVRPYLYQAEYFDGWNCGHNSHCLLAEYDPSVRSVYSGAYAVSYTGPEFDLERARCVIGEALAASGGSLLVGEDASGIARLGFTGAGARGSYIRL